MPDTYDELFLANARLRADLDAARAEAVRLTTALRRIGEAGDATSRLPKPADMPLACFHVVSVYVDYVLAGGDPSATVLPTKHQLYVMTNSARADLDAARRLLGELYHSLWNVEDAEEWTEEEMARNCAAMDAAKVFLAAQPAAGTPAVLATESQQNADRLKDAIRTFTVDRKDEDGTPIPNGPTEELMDAIGCATDHSDWLGVLDGLAKYTAALADDTKRLRDAAEAYFGGDFRVEQPAVGTTAKEKP